MCWKTDGRQTCEIFLWCMRNAPWSSRPAQESFQSCKTAAMSSAHLCAISAGGSGTCPPAATRGKSDWPNTVAKNASVDQPETEKNQYLKATFHASVTKPTRSTHLLQHLSSLVRLCPLPPPPGPASLGRSPSLSQPQAPMAAPAPGRPLSRPLPRWGTWETVRSLPHNALSPMR